MLTAETEDTHFATEVTDFSSQYGAAEGSKGAYVAYNLAGPTSVYPNYGDQTGSCVFRQYGVWWRISPMAEAATPLAGSHHYKTDQYIDVHFGGAFRITKVEIFETYNVGAVVGIRAAHYDEKDPTAPLQWMTLWRSNEPPTPQPPESRIFCPPLSVYKTPPVVYIRLELDCAASTYYTELDAVRITGQVDVNFPPFPKIPEPDIAAIFTLMDSLCISDECDVNDTDDADNPFHKLTATTAAKIFKFLALSDLGRFAQTSKLSMSLVYYYMRNLRKDLSLRSHWCSINDQSLAYLKQRIRSSGVLRRVDLSWCGNYGVITPHGFCAFLDGVTFAKNLTTLRLANCLFLDGMCLRAIVRECPKLTELDLASCRTLTEDVFPDLAKLRHLQLLNLYRCHVDDEALLHIVDSCVQLQHLNLDSCKKVANVDDILHLWSSKNPMAMRSLGLWRGRISNRGIQLIADHFHNVEELELGWCSGINAEAEHVYNMLTNCKKLRKIFFTAVRSISSKELEAIADNLPDMEQLDILGTSRVSEDAVRRVLQNCKKLRLFDISFCGQISHERGDSLREEYPHCAVLQSKT